MWWIRISAFAILLFPSPAVAQSAPTIADRFIHRAWGTRDGLPQNTVTAMVQTRDGYLWLGTFGGLVRFDGNAFTVFDPGNTPGLASARIYALHEGPSGTLWIATDTALSRFENGRFTSYPTQGDISAVHEDRSGRVWVGYDGGLKRFDGRGFVRVSLAPLATLAVSIAETPDGAVWVATWDGIARIDEHSRVTVVTRTRDTVRNLFVDRGGRLWVGSESLWRWDGSRFVEVPLPTTYAQHGVIHMLADDQEGNLWFGTAFDGVYRWHEGAVDIYNAAAGLTDRNARALVIDRGGNIWIGTNVGGLNRLTRRRARSYPRPGAIEESIGPIVDDGSDGLWIGGSCGGLLHFRAGTFRVLSIKDGLPGDCVPALFRDADGPLWMASAGLTRFHEDRFTTFSTRDGLASDAVQVITRDRDGVMWVGTSAGLSRFDGHAFLNYGRAQGLEHDVRTILQDRRGALWLGGTTGLSRFADGRFTRYTTAQGLSHEHVRAIYEDADGTLWIGTYGGGLNRLRDGRFTTFTIKQGLHDNAVSRIIEDDRGNLWMSGNKGVFRVARRELNDFADGRLKYIMCVSYGIADGMIIDETNSGQPAGWRTRDGTFWFPTIKGLVSIEPETRPADPPPVFVERVIAGGQPFDLAALDSIGSGRADVELHYTAVDLSAAEKTRFKYRLDGYDGGWIDSGARRVAYYTNIPPGRYRFEVIATSRDGVWSAAPAHIAFAVTPLWWQRRAVQAIGLALLLVATGYGVRFLSLRRARARLAALEREHALERERSRIARDLHDDLGSRLTHIAMMADAAASGDRRIAYAARDAARTMDELVWTVNARNDTVDGFAFYLAQFAEQHIVAAGVRCRLSLPPDLPARPLGAHVRRHLYLACKEAVNNAVKHAEASEIRVSLRVDGSRLVVEIADDGRGLPAELDPTGNGFRNYRERMDAAGGTLDVQSAAGSGTRITFSAPL
jgi:ligand-binding sensor domain-containing protein/signal transduction histidine kinase